MRLRPLVITLAVVLMAGSVFAGDLRITLPKRTKPTPVQKLNQDGVAAVRKHDYEKAKRFFYKAYLIDPNDPFTLNNLGYVAELEGDVDRAQRFYSLAADNASDATVSASSDPDLKGKPVAQVAGKTNDKVIQVNRDNVAAIGLLKKDRAPEADLLLQRALQVDPQNPFTLNNLGFAKEKQGEYEQALSYYTQSADRHSDESIVVSVDRDWRGKPISQIAADNARAVRKLMQKEETVEARVARLNLRGVSAMNRNDRRAARDYFEQAYKLAPENSFTLNNMGYLSELDGDRETADFYYAKAQEAKQNNVRVAVATRSDLEGKRVGEVATFGDDNVQQRIEAARQARVREGGPIQLHRRDNTPVVEPDKPPAPLPQAEQNEPQGPAEMLPPLPENRQPGAAPAGSAQPSQPPAQPGELLQPLPENEQPPAASAPNAQPNQPAANPGDVLPPLPENQQPPAAQSPSQQPAPQPTQPQQPGQQQGVIPPLPDNQQPPAAQSPTNQPQPPAQPQQQQKQQPKPKQPDIPH